jgi:hypothetical protein
MTAEQETARTEALLAAVLARHGARLDEAGIALVRERIEQSQAAAAAMRAVPLTNADEPDASFRAVTARDSV